MAITLKSNPDGVSGAIQVNGTDRLTLNNDGSLVAAVSPPQFDNDTSLATTAFVQRALGNMAGWKQISSSTTLSAADTGLACYVSGAAPITATLPALSTVPIGATFTFMSNSLNAVTVAGQSGELIALKNPTSLASISIQNGETLQVTKITSSLWMAVGGTATLKENAAFGSSLAASGYQKLPSGLIIQWLSVTTPTTSMGSTAFTFPIAFPNALVSVAIAPNFTVSSAQTPSFTVINRSTSGGALYNGGNALSGAVVQTTVIAIGY